MKIIANVLSLLLSVSVCFFSKAQTTANKAYLEAYRPQIHFSPKEHWTNDPNGMVYFNHTYHLFFQYYPDDIIWGPMHWGHAISKDLVHWKELPIALYPDSLGYIFSGSAVVDSNNTSGLGKGGKIPLVAIFTHHDPKGEKAGRNDFQNESIAYSLDEGKTWIKYAGNPVLKNPGIRDFRDPKVMWYAKDKKWVMTLATLDHITFYSSPNLKDWKKESEFGKEMGAHGGVWECPDLFPLKLNGETYWVLIVNLNPGGPNGGSATQYFVGEFDGNKFTPIDNNLRWVDYGPDEYAGITWSNTGSRRIFLGWMSNWQYANQVPTEKWRNAMTIPRELALKQINGEMLLASEPVKELTGIELKPVVNVSFFSLKRNSVLLSQTLPVQYTVKFRIDKVVNYSIVLSNDAGKKLVLGYDKASNRYYIDRTKSGRVDFNPEFAKTFFAPRLSTSGSSDLKLIVDASSIELFADNGLSVMTCVFFPQKPFNHLQFQNSKNLTIRNLKLSPLKSIW
ncbi:MAG TPA: glycoside hydrolase family 32 protein [Mucilaginibacter sp.]|jgi:fructan beta-fructosidase